MASATRGAQGKLVELAGTMRGAVESTGHHAHQKLPHGLEIVMQRSDGQWRLAMAREKVFPSDVEVSICRDAFNVPAGAMERRRESPRRHPKTSRLITYHVVELFWMER